MKYNKIVKCNFASFKDNDIIYGNVYLLTYNGCSEELEIDLTSNLWFNTEYKAINREIVKQVNNINEVMDFLKEHNITISEYAKKDIFDTENELVCVGGSNDYVLDYNLNVIGLKDNCGEVEEYIKKKKLAKSGLNGYEDLIKFEWEIIKENNTDFKSVDLTDKDITNIYDNIGEDLVFMIQENIYKYIENNFRQEVIYKRNEE